MMFYQLNLRDGTAARLAPHPATNARQHTLQQAVIQQAVAGGAGMLATFPMTAYMLWHFRHLPPADRYALPPREIMEQMAAKAAVRQHFSQRQMSIFTLVAHFGFGMGGGLLYALTAARLHKNPILQGVGFGLIFWALNYLGFIPAVRLLTPATEHPASRNALMIQAHVIWGACLGLLANVPHAVHKQVS